MMLPPPGVWLALSMEPTLAWAFSLKSSFTFSIRTWPPPGNKTARRKKGKKEWNPRGISHLQASLSPQLRSGQRRQHCVPVSSTWSASYCNLLSHLFLFSCVLFGLYYFIWLDENKLVSEKPFFRFNDVTAITTKHYALPGLWWMLDMEPHLAVMWLKSIFLDWIWTCGQQHSAHVISCSLGSTSVGKLCFTNILLRYKLQGHRQKGDRWWLKSGVR